MVLIDEDIAEDVSDIINVSVPLRGLWFLYYVLME